MPMTKSPDWQETLDDPDRRRQQTRALGGPERLAKHRGKGKLDARARIDSLLDPGTFRELGTLVGGEIAADGIVVGSGLINGSPVMLGAEDFTTLAGSIGPGGNSKRYRIAELALRDKVPLVMLLEGAGFRPGGGHYGRSPTDLLAQAQCSGRVPTVAAVLGPSAGHGALVAPVCDFRIMSRQGAIFTAGPPCRTPRRPRGRPRRRCRPTRPPSRARPRSCSTSSPATTGVSTTCAPC